ncbi:MAG: hypothetical protein AAF614_11130 [Chloroflexota bacterium]
MSKDLSRDVDILVAMAEEMEEYLRSDVLFWRIMNASTPRLTLGGYLLRQHRLLALEHLLSEEDKGRMETAVIQYNQALVEKIVRLEQKAHTELEARLRLWGESLRDVGRGSGINYETAVEVRAMIEVIMMQLLIRPYQLNDRITQQVALLDGNLRRRFTKGDFVWEEAWQSAYPQTQFWWLYGQPR